MQYIFYITIMKNTEYFQRTFFSFLYIFIIYIFYSFFITILSLSLEKLHGKSCVSIYNC